MRKRRLATLVASTGVLVAVPGVARAHGIGGRLDLPVPVSYFVVAAALVIVISFVGLALLWPRPRLQTGPTERVIGKLSKPVVGVLGFLGVVALLVVIAQIIPAILGRELVRGRPGIAPVLLWVVMWLVVPFSGALIGNGYTFLNPWRSLGGLARMGRKESPFLLARFGVWPATFAFFGFAWFELISPNSGSPETIGWAALIYSTYLFGSMAILGRETGLVTSDLFTTYNRIFSAISPIGLKDGNLIWRGWLRSLPVLPTWPGLTFFILTAIGTVSYDGASGTVWFRRATQSIIQNRLGQTALMAGTVALIAAGYFLASALAARLAGVSDAKTVARRFAHTLVPIALAYAVAHYFTLIIFEGQQIISSLSDPFGLGWDLFGTANRSVDFFVTATEPIWYFQLAVIITGHVLGVILAHDRALADFGRNAIRSQYAMLLMMVALTSLGLVILAG